MIEIYIGPYLDKDIPETDLIILDNVLNYPNLRLQIRDAIQQSKSVSLWVVEPVCYGWFWDLESSKHVRIFRISLLDQLQAKLRIPTLPALFHINPELIMN